MGEEMDWKSFLEASETLIGQRDFLCFRFSVSLSVSKFKFFAGATKGIIIQLSNVT